MGMDNYLWSGKHVPPRRFEDTQPIWTGRRSYWINEAVSKIFWRDIWPHDTYRSCWYTGEVIEKSNSADRYREICCHEYKRGETLGMSNDFVQLTADNIDEIESWMKMEIDAINNFENGARCNMFGFTWLNNSIHVASSMWNKERRDRDYLGAAKQSIIHRLLHHVDCYGRAESSHIDGHPFIVEARIEMKRGNDVFYECSA